MHRIKLTLFAFLAVIMLHPALALSHCQIPCGIYDDPMRITMLEEHIATIEKSMNLITELSSADDKNYNQIVRWVTNKDDHADQFIDIVANYFLAQRVQPADPSDPIAYSEYQNKTTLLHQMIYYAMKAKQTTDLKHVEKLRILVKEFHDLYFKK